MVPLLNNCVTYCVQNKPSDKDVVVANLKLSIAMNDPRKEIEINTNIKLILGV